MSPDPPKSETRNPKPETRILTGPHRSSRAARIDVLLHENLDRARLIVPTRRYARARTVALLERFDLPGILGRPIQSFEDFVSSLVTGTPYEQRRIGPIEQRLCLERAIAHVAANDGLETLADSAKTDGFLRHIQRVIGQLKQGAIEPKDFEHGIGARANARPIDRVVSRIYSAYQTILKDLGAYDLQGLYWMAYLSCAETSPPALADVDLLLVDDFDDFTPSEFRVLESLRTHAALVFGVRLDMNPDRADLYALPLRTLARLQAAFNITGEQSLNFDPPQSQTEYVADNLFWRNKPPAFDGANNVRLIACHDLRHELETAAREVKRILREVPEILDRIAIVAPDMAEIGEPLTSLLREFGVPFIFPVAVPVTTAATGLVALRLLEALESFEHDAVVALILDVHVQRAVNVDMAAARQLPAAIRATGFVHGKAAWLRIADATRNEALRTLLVYLAEQRAKLEEAATTVERIDTMYDAIAACAAHSERDAAAWRAILESLTQWRDAIAADGQQDLESFFKALRTTLGETRVPPDLSGPGVQCLDVESARHLSFEHVFFIGLNEGAIPARVPRNAVYSTADLARLRSAGIELGDADVHRERERLLFHHVFETAHKSLILTWHTMTKDGKAALRSPFAADVEELLKDTVCVERPESPAAALLPKLDHVACERDLENVAGQIAHPERHLLNWDAIAAGHNAEKQRAFGPFNTQDGVLVNTEVRDAVAIRFGDEYVFSATELETYIDCPFRFLLQRLLKINEIDDEPTELDPKTRGIRMHAALQRFHERFLRRSWREIDEGEAHRAMDEAVDAVFGDRERRYSPALWQAERERMRALLHRYIRIERKRDRAGWKPAHTEFLFGRGDGPGPCIVATELGPFCYSGRIDRIDELDDQLRIVDYKSSPVAANQINDGNTIQLILYAWAVEQLRGRDCASAEYIVPGKTDRCDALTRKKTDQCRERQETVRRRLVESLRGIRAGHFHLTLDTKHCSYCPANKVCRYERGRIERKSAPAP